MPELILHPKTRDDITRCIARPAHAIMLVAPTGSGKLSLARYMAASILDVEANQLDKYPYFMTVSPNEKRVITIDIIRELQHFTTLRIPGNKDISRLVIIESAELMTVEAQNALLKSLEEPPQGTVFILTASATDALLPTIQSRVRPLHVVSPTITDFRQHLLQTYTEKEVDNALLLSGGLPGLTTALLSDPETHPLFEATRQARKLLQSTQYERLLLVDSLSKQKALAADVTFILGQMAHMALARSSSSSAKRWQGIMKAAYEAQEQLHSNAQTKLTLMNLMLKM